MNEETSLMWQIACFCVCGALLGVLYEPLRILRLIIPHHSFITGVEDTVYLSLCGVVLFGLSMETGNGNFRLSYLLAAFVGGVVYLLTVGRLIKIIYSAVIKTVFKAVKLIGRKILRPVIRRFVSIAHKLMLPFVKLYENIDAKMKKHKADLKTSPEMLYNNINNHGRNEMSVGNRIEGKIGKIQ